MIRHVRYVPCMPMSAAALMGRWRLCQISAAHVNRPVISILKQKATRTTETRLVYRLCQNKTASAERCKKLKTRLDLDLDASRKGGPKTLPELRVRGHSFPLLTVRSTAPKERASLETHRRETPMTSHAPRRYFMICDMHARVHKHELRCLDYACACSHRLP